MPITKCKKCGEKHESLQSMHICKVEAAEKKKREKQKWGKASGLRRIFMFDPEASFAARAVSIVWMLPGIAVPIVIFVLIPHMIRGEPSWGVFSRWGIKYYFEIYAITVSMGGLLLGYGISHLKRWSLVLYPALIIFYFIWTEVLWIGLASILTFIVLVVDRKKFH